MVNCFTSTFSIHTLQLIFYRNSPKFDYQWLFPRDFYVDRESSINGITNNCGRTQWGVNVCGCPLLSVSSSLTNCLYCCAIYTGNPSFIAKMLVWKSCLPKRPLWTNHTERKTFRQWALSGKVYFAHFRSFLEKFLIIFQLQRTTIFTISQYMWL